MSRLTPINDIMSRATIGAPEPEVGMGATSLSWSDRDAYTVIGVSKNGTQAVIQEDKATRLDKNGMSESQDYEFTPNPDAPVRLIRKMPNGQWRMVSLVIYDERGQSYPGKEAVLALIDKKRGQASDGTVVAIGYRRKYHDYSF